MNSKVEFQQYIQALAACEQIWQTIIDTPLIDIIGKTLEKGFLKSYNEMDKEEAKFFSKSICTIVRALLELNINITPEEYQLLINIIKPTGLTAFPVGWIILRPWYRDIVRIADKGCRSGDEALLESVLLLLGSELVHRREEKNLNPDPNGSEKEDMLVKLEQSRQYLVDNKIVEVLPVLVNLISWFYRGGEPALGKILPDPDPEIKSSIPTRLLTSVKMLVQHINEILESKQLARMVVDGIIYATHPDKGGVFIKNKQDSWFSEICEVGTTPLFKSSTQFRRWIGSKLGVKGRKTQLSGWIERKIK